MAIDEKEEREQDERNRSERNSERNDDQRIEASSPALAAVDDSKALDGIVETIKVPFKADLTPSQHAKIIRQIVNLLHALLSNSMRYAAIGDGRNAGAGFPIHQQTYTAAANLDAAAKMLEDGSRQVLSGQLPPNANRIGRA